jgi:hypothetical protein
MKEKLSKKIIFNVQKTLYEEFKMVCESQYKTMAEVMRNFMLQYVKDHKSEKIDNRTVYRKS